MPGLRAYHNFSALISLVYRFAQDRAKGREIDARFVTAKWRDVPHHDCDQVLARSLKQFRSNRLQKPRWLSAAETGDLDFIQKRLRRGGTSSLLAIGVAALWTAVRLDRPERLSSCGEPNQTSGTLARLHDAPSRGGLAREP